MTGRDVFKAYARQGHGLTTVGQIREALGLGDLESIDDWAARIGGWSEALEHLDFCHQCGGELLGFDAEGRPYCVAHQPA